MRWQGGDTGGNVEDRRGIGGVAAAGGGIGAVVLALVGYFVFGIDPSTTMKATQQMAPAQQQQGVVGSPRDEAGKFVDVVETSTTQVWSEIFSQSGQRYQPPAAVVIYGQEPGAMPSSAQNFSTGTGCGLGQSAMGPFYCPRDQKVYLDLGFWSELESQFGARGEFARAYVIAHEIGHHVQNLTGQMAKAERFGGQGEDSGAVRLELQADCYAGVWAAHAGTASGGKIAIDGADIESGLSAASAVGDDTIQRRTQGRVVPDAFTHGTAQQRMAWFRRGYDQGDPAACDTFARSV